MIHFAERGFHPLDYVIFSLVCAVSLAIGLYHAFTGGKQKTTKEIFMADHNLKTIPVALSMLVSFVSAVLVLGTPAEVYTRGTLLTTRVVGYCFACILSSLLFVPLFYSIKVTSSFEFLEKRYNSQAVKLIGSFMMLIGNVFYMGLVMYTPSTALEAVVGFPVWGTVLVTGIISTIYTSVGGVKAVIWTDVFQSFIMIAGMLAIVIAGAIRMGGLSKVLTVSQQGGRLLYFNFDPDPTQRLTTWSLWFGGMFSTLTIFGIGQVSVQRYCSLPTLSQAKRSVYLNIPGLIVVNLLATLVGLVVYAYYADAECDPLKQGFIKNANQIVPYFIRDVLNYPGFPGVFLAVLFSGALSSMSSLLNSASAVTWEDILKPFFKHISERKKAFLTKVLVVCYGGLAVIVSFLADGLGGHVLQASLSFTGATTGPSLGMFVLGAFFRSANAIGAVVGCAVSLSFSLWLAIGTFIHKPYQRTTLATSVEKCALRNSTELSVSAVFNRVNRTTYDALVGSSSLNRSQLALDPVITTEGVTTVEPEFSLEGLNKLYGVSFLWYSAFGCLLCVAVGLVVSYLTRNHCANEYDPSLIVPVYDRLCCCCRFYRRRKSDTFKKQSKQDLNQEEVDLKSGLQTEECKEDWLVRSQPLISKTTPHDKDITAL